MSSTNQGPRRIGQWVYLRPECIEEYKKCHAEVWPAVLEQIKDSNIKDCISPLRLSYHIAILQYPSNSTDSIYLSLSPRPTLFASFKYVGNAFDKDMERMAANPTVQEWWQMTDRMQESPVEGAVGSASGPGWWGQTEEVFYME
jgi:L-rhamnose mutarotase